MSAQIERGSIASEVIGRHFTTIFNGAIRDRRISWKTKGILAWLLSHQEGFQFSVKAIVAAGPDGEAAVRSALKELESFGYLDLKERPRDKGKITGYVYRVTDMPNGMPRLDRYLGEISNDQQGEGKSPGQDHTGESKQALTSDFSSEEKLETPYGDYPHVVEPHVADRAHKKTTFEEDHVSPNGETEEEHTLRAARSGAALPGGERDPGGRPSIEEIAGPGSNVAREVIPGHGGDCDCASCRVIRRRLGISIPQQPTGSMSQNQQQGEAVAEPEDDWISQMFRQNPEVTEKYRNGED